MALNIKLKEAFEVENQYGAFYTGGKICWTSDGKEFLCQDSNKINVVNIDSGVVSHRLCHKEGAEELEEDTIYSFDLSSDDETVITAHRSGLLKLWNKVDGTQLKVWKAGHRGPIATVVFRSKGSVVATGGSDSTVRVWDFEKKACLCALKESQGVINLVVFHSNVEKKLVFGAGDDNKINCWNYATKQLEQTFTGHYSKVTSISFSDNYIISVSRDKVLILWDILTGAQKSVIPLYETLEGVIVLPKSGKLPNAFSLESPESKDHVFAAIAGESGRIKVWECVGSKIVYSQTESFVSKAEEEGGLAITQLLHCPKTSQLAVVTADHNILVHNISTFHCSKQLIGFSDEILDICFVGKKNRYLALASNSNDIKFYDTTNMNCQILKGHTDIVLTLSSHKNFLLSSGKDHTIYLWEVDPGSFTIKCLAKGTKHTSSVGSVAFGKVSHTIFASVSQDTCLKVWEIPKKFEEEDQEMWPLQCKATQIAHEKDINCVVMSPNDQLIATASQDKTAKIWSASKLELLGVFRGHRRGVWCVRFSPVDQILLTSSADSTMRLWNISDNTCLKAIEGHEASVLRAEFISKGLQIVSAGADGLVKVWNIKNNECTTTLDKHDGKIWSICISNDERYFFTGAADSQLIKWKDVTEDKRIKEMEAKQEEILQEQELQNLLAQNKTLKALKLALRLEKPFLTLKIINSVIKDGLGGADLENTIGGLNDLHKEKLLNHASSWNTNSKNCRPAQLVLNILLNEAVANDFRPQGLSKIVEETIPYTERHFKRMTEYLKDLQFLEFTLRCMQPYKNGKVISNLMEVEE